MIIRCHSGQWKAFDIRKGTIMCGDVHLYACFHADETTSRLRRSRCPGGVAEKLRFHLHSHVTIKYCPRRLHDQRHLSEQEIDRNTDFTIPCRLDPLVVSCLLGRDLWSLIPRQTICSRLVYCFASFTGLLRRRLPGQGLRIWPSWSICCVSPRKRIPKIGEGGEIWYFWNSKRLDIGLQSLSASAN
nr:hypothetical protein CFP56_36369 [Quercus suber]